MIILLELYFIMRVYLSSVYDNDWAPRSSHLTLVASGTLVERPNPKDHRILIRCLLWFLTKYRYLWRMSTYVSLSVLSFTRCLLVSFSFLSRWLYSRILTTNSYLRKQNCDCYQNCELREFGILEFLIQEFIFFFFFLFPFKRRLIS